MKITIRGIIVIAALGGCLVTYQASFADEYDATASFEVGGFDEIDEFDVLSDLDERNHGSYQPVVRATACVDPQEVLDLITCPAGPGIPFAVEMQNRLQENFYLFTNPPNQRSLLDLPEFLLHLQQLPSSNWQFNTWWFYNQTSQAFYTSNSPLITSYLNVNSDVLLAGVEEALIEFDSPIDLPLARELFGFIKLQERRSGFMFDFYYNHNRWNFEWKMPLYYFERNFFVTSEEQKRLEEIFQFETDTSIYKHALSDQVGIGDTRLNLGYLAVDKDWVAVNVGGLMTIPTGFAFARGLVGAHFQKNSNVGPFDFLTLAQLGICDHDVEAIQVIAFDFLTDVADKLAANILQTGMGNNGHVGLGLFVEKHMQFTPRFRFKTRAELEYLFPASERRFYITKKLAKEFTDLEPYCEATDGKAAEKLDFLNEQFILTLVPRVYSTSIYPGFIFKMQSGILGTVGRTWEMGAGFDIWAQSKEKLGRIKAQPVQLQNIRLDNASRAAAFQTKLFGIINYYKGRNHDWSLGLYGDYTVLNGGIGKDFNLSLRFSLDY